MTELNARQERFCQEYIVDLNGQKAAERAGYSAKTARSQASTMLTKPNIQQRITELKNRRAARVEVTQDAVLREIMKVAFGNATDFIEITEKGVRVKDLEGVDTTFISSAKDIFDKDGVRCGTDVRFQDKMKALEMLARHIGLYDQRDGGDGVFDLKALVKIVESKECET